MRVYLLQQLLVKRELRCDVDTLVLLSAFEGALASGVLTSIVIFDSDSATIGTFEVSAMKD